MIDWKTTSTSNSWKYKQ